MTGITCLYTGIAIIGLIVLVLNAIVFWFEHVGDFYDCLPFYVVFLVCIVMIFSGAYMAYKCYDKDFEIMMQNSTIEYERSNKVERKLN